MWIDNHCHLNMLETSVEDAISQAKTNGINKFVNIGTTPEDLDIVYNTAKKHYPSVFCTQGVHPHDAKLYDQQTEEKIIKRIPEPEVIAVGEIGLDFYYDNSPHEKQVQVFKRQLEIAKVHSMPVQIHTRDAEKETIEILESVGKVSGVLHCFTGSPWLAEEGLRLGLNISISGIVTFKKANALQDLVKSIPLDRIHIETDSPFLAPVPQRGKKNTPAYLIHVAEFVAQLKGISVDQLSKACEKNTRKVFPKFL